jgi:DNA-binding transcriptional MocR family regulator
MTNTFPSIVLERNDPATPVYRQIADAISSAVQAGTFPPGCRLSPQRDLARELGVNLTTISRAYAELRRLGIVVGSPSRGTFVRYQAAADPDFRSGGEEFVPHDPRFIDLSVNAAPTPLYRQYLAQTLLRLADDPRFAALEDYQPAAGPSWARETGADWIGRAGQRPDPGQVVVTAGAQAGLFTTLAAICRRDDVILANHVTYFGLRALANRLNFRLRGIATDEHGPLPEAVAAACADGEVRALFTVPCLDNPTATTIPLARRVALADVARRLGIYLIEDDIYGPLLAERPPPIASLYPERTIYITGVSKALAPGLRVGFVLPPRELTGAIAEVVRETTWMSPPLSMLIATNWIEDGTADRILDSHRTELRARQDLAAKLLTGLNFDTNPYSTHIWLHLPEPWRSTDFTAQLQARGVRIMASEAFATGSSPVPHAVRINIGAARSREQLRTALETILATLAQRPKLPSAGAAP